VDAVYKAYYIIFHRPLSFLSLRYGYSPQDFVLGHCQPVFTSEKQFMLRINTEMTETVYDTHFLLIFPNVEKNQQNFYIKRHNNVGSIIM
jgi:hypothetical protein